jgi:hypothetical protein
MLFSLMNTVAPDPRPRGNAWYLGLDLGQRRDYSALATIEQVWIDEGLDKVTYARIRTPRLIIRAIERFRLGTSYLFYNDAIQQRLREIEATASSLWHKTGEVSLVIDAGGPGAPVVEDIRRAQFDLTLYPVFLTGGATPSHAPGGFTNVPRRSLISNMTLLADRGLLTAQPGLDGWAVLRDELLEIGVHSTQPVTASAHDDIVMAVAMAAWQATYKTPELRPVPKQAKAHWCAAKRLF